MQTLVNPGWSRQFSVLVSCIPPMSVCWFGHMNRGWARRGHEVTLGEGHTAALWSTFAALSANLKLLQNTKDGFEDPFG